MPQRPHQLLTLDELKEAVGSVPNFPKPGILFRDITTLISNGPAFASSIEYLAEMVTAIEAEAPVDHLAGVEARGFIFAAVLGYKLGKPVILVRKPGKLPRPKLALEYDLEYGSATLEVHADDVPSGANVVVVDDLLATGGTVTASASLLRSAGASVYHTLVVIELPDLDGRQKLAEIDVATHSVLNFEGH